MHWTRLWRPAHCNASHNFFNKQLIPQGLQPRTIATRCQQSSNASCRSRGRAGASTDATERERGHNNELSIFLVGVALRSAAFSEPLSHERWRAECPEGSWKEDGPSIGSAHPVTSHNYLSTIPGVDRRQETVGKLRGGGDAIARAQKGEN